MSLSSFYARGVEDMDRNAYALARASDRLYAHRRIGATGTISIAPGADHVEQWNIQKGAMAGIRGERPHPSIAGKTVPQTTVADVFGLLEYWTNEGDGKEGMTDSLRWTKEASRAVQLAANLPGDALYPENARIWYDGFLRRAIDLQSVGAIPSRWDLVKESVGEAIDELPGRVRDAAAFVWPDFLTPVVWALAIGAGFLGLLWLVGPGGFRRWSKRA